MARRIEPPSVAPGADESRPLYLQHRYMRGLRFDGLWEHPVKTPAGRWRWKALPLLEAPSASAEHQDPEGVWWCISRCIAFMAQRDLKAFKLPKGRRTERSPRLATEEVVHVLQEGLLGHAVQVLEIGAADAVTDLATVPNDHGSALLRLERTVGGRGGASACWIWMVGVETLHQDLAEDRTPSDTAGLFNALLVVGSRWPAPWGCGFGAKVLCQEGGSWKLSSVDGEVMRGRLTAWIDVTPVEVH